MNDSIGTRHKMSTKDNQMKAKLTEMGIYEEGMGREEMEHILKALDSSKNDTLSQSPAGDVSLPSLETESLKRQTSVEYDDETPPINQRPCESKSQNINTIVDSDEDIFDHKIDNNDKNNTINRQTSTPSYANMLQQKNVNNRTMKMFSKIDNLHNELRRMDPLDHEDIPHKPLLPLRINNPPTQQTRITIINKKPIIPLDEFESIKKHLDNVIEQWNKWELETSDEAEFRWGAPIQVGDDSAVNERQRTRTATATTTTTATQERRGDDDNNVENYHENTGVALRTVDDYNDNLTQRAYVTPRRQTAKTDPYNFGDDDDDDDNTFQSQAKRPKNNNINANNNLAALRNRPPMRRKGLGPGTSQQKKYDSNEDDDDEEWYGDGKKNEMDKSFEIPDDEYAPRRIPPPSRAKYVRSRNTNAQSNPLQITKQNNKGNKKVDVEEMDISESPKKPTKGPLKDDQITDLINDDDDEQNNTPDDVIDDDDEEETKLAKARSLIPAHNKLNVSLTILRNKQKTLKDQELRAEEEERIKKEKEEAAKREKLNARMTKNNNLEREKENERRMRKEKEDKYRQIFPKLGGASDRNELRSDGDTVRPVPTVSWDPKAVAFPVATNRSTPNQKAKNVKKVNCPICNKLFPEADVAAHASTCNEFSDGNQQEPDVELVGTSTSSASSYKHVCGICNNYSTNNINDYADHQHNCNFKLHSRDGEASGSQSDKSVIDVDDQDMDLGFKPISKLDNPDLYNNQFKVKKPSGKSPAIINRKRKR